MTFVFLLILIALQLLLLLYFGAQKKGMHFDEFFSYFNTNNSAGREAYDRSRVTSEQIFQDFYVKPGEQFNYPYVVKLQGYDVHPPVYYLFLHTLCSLMPGVYSIWQGVALNIFFALLTTIFWYLIAKELTENEAAAFLLTLILIVNPGVVSNVMFVRMYCLLTLWFSIVSYLHLRMEKEGIRPVYIVLNALLAYVGFLTHYFYLVFLFFIELPFAAGYLIGLKRRNGTKANEESEEKKAGEPKSGFRKEFGKLLIYYGALLAAGILAVVSFPQCLGHVHSGYRGKEVQSYLFNLSDFGYRMKFFGDLLNRYVFGGAGVLFAVFLAVMLVTAYVLMRKEKRQIPDRIFRFLKTIAIPSAGYYLLSVKASLVGDEAMMRYQLPVYGMILFGGYFLLFSSFEELHFTPRFLSSSKIPAGKGTTSEKWARVGPILAFLCLVSSSIAGISGEKVYYLYPEQAMMKETAAKYADLPCVYIYNSEDSKYLLWNDSEQLWLYDSVYFVCSENREPLTDETIRSADELIVYVSTLNEEDFGVYADLIERSNPSLRQYEKLYDAMYAEVYRFY
ncbi:MAG: glycosyltransferase family 39 protein [Lachnospiraceae bacterium]|nr:glycosyltransferase family 39 protein [Lachnospiraceae bacterium]